MSVRKTDTFLADVQRQFEWYAIHADWDEHRTDCTQGRLKTDVMAERWAVCDIPIDTAKRQSPIKIKLDGTCIWANGKTKDQ